jgi:hypothetical protein
VNANATTTRAKARYPRWKIVVAILSPLAFCALLIGILVCKFVYTLKGQLKETDAGFRKITNTLDAEAVRQWALEMNRKKASQSQIAESMPKELRNVYNEPPEVEFDDSGLALNWGGGDFHWVLYIGGTNNILPFHSANQDYPFNFEWRPGIYYTREANLELQ